MSTEMLHGDSAGLLAGAVLLGAVHGIEPGHGWPVAASYALDRTNKWVYGFVASLIIGVGHLVSSLAMVAVFFYAKGYFELTQINEPIAIADGIHVGGPVSLVAGVLLIGLGLREYRHGHSHGSHSHGHDDHEHGEADRHDHDDHTHEHEDDHHHGHEEHEHTGGHDHGQADAHDHGSQEAVDRGLFGIAWFAFVLGFAHEEEFEIIALCAGSTHCLELMGAYAVTVVVGIVALTLLLIAGYQQYEERLEAYTPYLPIFSAVVLVIMGAGFITGLF